MMRQQPIHQAFSHFAHKYEGALICFDREDGTFLFYRGSAVVAFRHTSEPISKGPDGQPVVVLSRERTMALKKRVEDEGRKFIILRRKKGGGVWQEEAVKVDLSRFVEVHTLVFDEALGEIRAGEKYGHWMWYIFPQLRGLGMSEMSEKYGIVDLEEARAFLRHPYLGKNLTTITKAVLEHAGKKSAVEIFGTVDAMKLRSSMTLFELCRTTEGNVFARVLDAFYDSKRDSQTLSMLMV